jgi:hypothetical protein
VTVAVEIGQVETASLGTVSQPAAQKKHAFYASLPPALVEPDLVLGLVTNDGILVAVVGNEAQDNR